MSLFFHHSKEYQKIKALKPWEKRRFFIGVLSVAVIGTLYLGFACAALLADAQALRDEWSNRLTPDAALLAKADACSTNAVTVYCGTYFENLKELSLKNSSFRANVRVWFRWQGDPAMDMINHFRFIRGVINAKHILKESHQNGISYQLAQLDVTISKDFSTNDFPLDSHLLNLYLESEYPIEQVRLRADMANSAISGNLGISDYRITKSFVSEYVYLPESTYGDPEYETPAMTSQIVTSLEITCNGFGLYLKCFIALFGTSIWVFITMFICTNHHVNPLSMIPPALLGSVSNIMIGASLLPDALTLGLLEYINIWGVMTILAGALYIINVNRIRDKFQNEDFAYFFGRIIFVLLLGFTLTGHVLLPYCAYL